MFHNILVISFILILSYLYLYVKSESFYSTNTNNNSLVISKQLKSEIARVLKISPRRITNLIYTDNIKTSGGLNVSFMILEPNIIEYSKEMSSIDASKKTNDLITNNNFKVNINGVSVLLSKIKNKNTTKPVDNYFNNQSLKDISNYALKKYNSVPNDASLTNFYKLDIDDNFNISPKLVK